MSNYIYSNNLNCFKELDNIRKKYGYYLSKNRYFFCYDPIKMIKIFNEIRNNGKYINNCGKFKISRIRDLTTPGYDSETKDNKPILPISSSTQMITFFLLKMEE